MFLGKIKIAAATMLTASLLAGGAAGASTMYDGAYDATSVNTNGNLHSIWLPNLISNPYDNYWQFVGGAGTVSVDGGADTLNVSGQIENNGNEANGTNFLFEVDMNFAYREGAFENAGDPMRQPAKTVGGSENETWEYFNMTNATLTGAGDLLGLVLTLTGFSKSETKVQPFQIGVDANDKNAGFGASAWFSWEVTQNSTHFQISDSSGHQHGDLNINLEAVPLPAAGWLLIAGVAGLGAMRRRQKRT